MLCRCVCRPLRADERLPVLTHRLVPDVRTGDEITDKKTTSHRRRKDSHKHDDRSRRDRQVRLCHSALRHKCVKCDRLLLYVAEYMSFLPVILDKSSSRMRVINHNWSATKQRLHPLSIAEISRHSVLSGDRIRQCDTSSGSHHKDTDQCL